MDSVHKEEFNGKSISIWYDEHMDKPEMPEGVSLYSIVNRHFSLGYGVDRAGMSELIKGAKTYNRLWFPVHAYVHGGVAFSLSPFSCPWDSGICGYFIIERSAARQAVGYKVRGQDYLAAVNKYAESLLSEWNDYVQGNCYGFTIQDVDGTILESVGGYVGDYEKNALPEARKLVS